MRSIRITSPPPGEAPENVRSAWVGIIIPLAITEASQPNVWNSRGVLGRDRGLIAKVKRFFGTPTVEQPSVGYVVEVLTAVAALRKHAPEAASWWEQHTPHLLKPGAKFLFDAASCELLPSDAP